jgi:hypothetical protein
MGIPSTALALHLLLHSTTIAREVPGFRHKPISNYSTRSIVGTHHLANFLHSFKKNGPPVGKKRGRTFWYARWFSGHSNRSRKHFSLARLSSEGEWSRQIL